MILIYDYSCLFLNEKVILIFRYILWNNKLILNVFRKINNSFAVAAWLMKNFNISFGHITKKTYIWGWGLKSIKTEAVFMETGIRNEALVLSKIVLYLLDDPFWYNVKLFGCVSFDVFTARNLTRKWIFVYETRKFA